MIKTLLGAAVLFLASASRPLCAEVSPFEFDKAVLINEIQAWESWYKPTGGVLFALSRIRLAAESAQAEPDLVYVNREFDAWKLARKGDLLLEEYQFSLAHDPPDLRSGSFEQFAAARIAAMHKQASEATDVQEALEWGKAHQSIHWLSTHFERSGVGGSYFDQGRKNPPAAHSTVPIQPAPPVRPACVLTAAPPSPKIPAAFAGVRRLLLSLNADPVVVDNAIDESIRQGRNPIHTLALIMRESSARRSEDGVTPIISKKGAVGVMQVMPGTAAGEYHVYDLCKLAELRTNLQIGIDYWNKKILDRFARGVSVFADPRRLTKEELAKLKLALAAYNIGPTRVAKERKIPAVKETTDYVDAVLANMRTLAARMPSLTAKR